MKVTTAVLRDIDKVGGLDEYLLKQSFQAVLGERGQKLRQKILTARRGDASMPNRQQKKVDRFDSRTGTLLDGIRL